MPELRLERVHRSFQVGARERIDVLKNVDLSIEQGDFISISGPSGGGKSTLLNVIGLLDLPTKGRYLIGGVDTGRASERNLAELRSQRFAFIFQSFHLLDRRRVVDSVELGLLYRSVPSADRRRRAIQALEDVGLEDKWAVRASRLSGGERQRVAIARALASGAPIVVADEPTGNLDSANSDSIMRSLRSLNERGCTIILVTHSAEVAANARKQLHLRDGHLTQTSDTNIAKESPASHSEPPAPPGSAARIRIRDVVADAIASLRSRPARTAGLAAAVALGVALAVTTAGISVSGSAQVSDTFNLHTNRDVTVEWTPTNVEQLSSDERTSIPDRLAQISGVDKAGVLADFGGHAVQPTLARPSVQVPTYGVSRDLLVAARIQTNWAKGHGGRLGPGEALVGANLARQLQMGSTSGGPVVALDGRDVAVVGIVTASPRVPEVLGAVVVADSDARFLGQANNSRALILTTAGAASQVARQAPLVVNPYGPKQLAVSAPVDPTTLRSAIEADVSSTLLAFTSVALLAAIAALANAMILSVIERKQEFGLRRALGARPQHIASLVMTESGFIGIVGGIAGLVVGLLAVLVVTIGRHWSPVFDLRLGPVAVAGGIVVGATGGVMAAIRASRVQPQEALRQ